MRVAPALPPGHFFRIQDSVFRISDFIILPPHFHLWAKL